MVSHSRLCSLENGDARATREKDQSAKEGMRETEAEEERACGHLSSLCLPGRVEGEELVGCAVQDAPRPCASMGATSCPPDSLQPHSGQAQSPESG